MGKIKELNPQEGEVVKIKFKTMNEIIANSSEDFHDTNESYAFSENTKAYIAGSHFLVTEAYEPRKDDKEGDEDITVRNHLDCVWDFTVFEDAIESIEIIDHAENFCSNDHKVLIVRVEDELFINGQPLIWNEDLQRKQHKQNGEEGPYKNENRKLLKMFENYIADLAVKESFKPGVDE